MVLSKMLLLIGSKRPTPTLKKQVYETHVLGSYVHPEKNNWEPQMLAVMDYFVYLLNILIVVKLSEN